MRTGHRVVGGIENTGRVCQQRPFRVVSVNSNCHIGTLVKEALEAGYSTNHRLGIVPDIDPLGDTGGSGRVIGNRNPYLHPTGLSHKGHRIVRCRRGC